MTPSFPEIIKSRLFKFIVGERIDGTSTEFSVHEEAIAQLSKPLYKLVKGEMLEARTGCAIWKDVSKETFERLVQFAYTGDYSIPSPRELDKASEPRSQGLDDLARRASGSSPGPSEQLENEVKDARPVDYDSYEELRQRSRAKKKKSKIVARYSESPPPSLPSRKIAADFHSLQYSLLGPRDVYHHTCEPAGDFEPGHSYSNVFLAHSCLYVLADYWLIDTLKALAVYKLHKTLCIYQLSDGTIVDIIDLARHAYKEEGKGSEEGIGILRSLVCRYMSDHSVMLSLYNEFTDFLAEGGQFVKDFFQFAIERMQ